MTRNDTADHFMRGLIYQAPLSTYNRLPTKLMIDASVEAMITQYACLFMLRHMHIDRERKQVDHSFTD